VRIYNDMKAYIDPYAPPDLGGMFGLLGEQPGGIAEMYGRMTSLLETLDRNGNVSEELAFRGVSEIVKQLDRALAEHRIPCFKTELDGLVTRRDLAVREFEAAVDKKNKDFGSILARLREISLAAAPASSDDAVTVRLASLPACQLASLPACQLASLPACHPARARARARAPQFLSEVHSLMNFVAPSIESDGDGDDGYGDDTDEVYTIPVYTIPRSRLSPEWTVGREELVYHVVSKALGDMPDKTANLNDGTFVDLVNRYLKQVSPSGLRGGKLLTRKSIKKASRRQAFAPYVMNSGKKRSDCFLQLKDPKKGKWAVRVGHGGVGHCVGRDDVDDDSQSDSDDGSLAVAAVAAGAVVGDHGAGPSTRRA